MLKRVGILAVLVLCQLTSPSQAKPQHESFNLGYSDPYSSLSVPDGVAMHQPAFHLPFHPYHKVLEGEPQGTQGQLGLTIYVTETRDLGRHYLITSYCTTSTTALSVCTPSGRRKRFSKGVRGLFYEEEGIGEQAKIEDDSNILLHNIPEEFQRDDDPANNENQVDTKKDGTYESEKTGDLESKSINRLARKAQDYPYLLPSDFQSEFKNSDDSRFFPIYVTVTSWVRRRFRTYVSTITATCISTTSFRTCGNGYYYGGWGDYGGDYDY